MYKEVHFLPCLRLIFFLSPCSFKTDTDVRETKQKRDLWIPQISSFPGVQGCTLGNRRFSKGIVFPLQSLSGGENIFFVLINHCLVFASNVFLPSFFLLATFLIHNLPLYPLFLLFKYTVRFFSIKIRG